METTSNDVNVMLRFVVAIPCVMSVRSKLVVEWAVELSDLNLKIHLTLQLSVYFSSVFVTIWNRHEVDM